ncbi:flagellar protein FliS [Silvibacterium bohemicum]|uniref:Flagellar protein FliS n=1 Tax=Silvibacterium bohemicum TaxID=1577686 RepID=A0A841K0N8_9BACT|nr:flagellar export chaperone FliS [Silvibacterium bohemicum]MBB6146545.1 flagellar protein FliS [Silvibacterium bohemicum]
MSYQQQTVAGMNGVELIVALYDGMVRFLYRAIQAVENNDIAERRIAIKRTLDILMHLQSRLRMDIGGSSARALSEFYAAIFALCIEGSRLASADRLREAIACIRDVREAWQVAARDPEVIRKLQEEQLRNSMPNLTPSPAAPVPQTSSTNWSA